MIIAIICGASIVGLFILAFMGSPTLPYDPYDDLIKHVKLDEQKESESSVNYLFDHQVTYVGTNFVTWKNSDGSDLIRCLACSATWSTGTVSTNIVHLAKSHNCYKAVYAESVVVPAIKLPAPFVPVGRKFR
jgi:hypothetical protein